MDSGPRNEGASLRLPDAISAWFTARGWSVRSHQSELAARVLAGDSALLVAPTGSGKTLAGFLASLIELAAQPPGRARRAGVHTLYVSPLKALTVDVARNLTHPVAEMGLNITIETRTGDTPQSRRQRQRLNPPDILLTTPEQICLLMASPGAAAFFADLKTVVVDEVHAIAPTKRGDLLALALAAVERFAPGLRRIGLSATVADPPELARWLAPSASAGRATHIVTGPEGATPTIDILESQGRIPWASHTGRHAISEVYDAIAAARTTLVFVNTRFQAELIFQELWKVNRDGLPIALHHGSLDVQQRRRVEAAMAAGALRAVVCTSTLDLGIDWGDVDLVIQMGAPKGAARFTQRIGRANHRLDEPSRALLAPANRFEALECRAARAAALAGLLDAPPSRTGALDALCQHILGRACGAPFSPDDLYAEVKTAAPFSGLERRTFDEAVSFVETGGYALKSYERFRRLAPDREGRLKVRNAEIAKRHRLNIGAIVEAPMVQVRLSAGRARVGRALGTVEEYFIEHLAPGDTFLFAGQVLRFEGLSQAHALVTRANHEDPKVPSFEGGRFPLSTFLADGVRNLIQDEQGWPKLETQVREWLMLQKRRSRIPKADEMLVETFPRGGRFYLVAYPFDGRPAHSTLGFLLCRRLERLGLQPSGFVCNDYALAVWGLKDLSAVDLQDLFHEDMLSDDLDEWLAESALLKRTFRNCAVIAGLIERRFPGMEKTGRQVTFSSDLIYDVLKKHEPNHILLRAAWNDAGDGLLDIRRLSSLLVRIKGAIRPVRLTHISPFAVPVMLEIGKEPVPGEASESVLADAARELIEEASAL